MIGTQIRGFRHLKRTASTDSLQTAFINFKEYGLQECKVINAVNDDKYNGTLHVFNQVINCHNWHGTDEVVRYYMEKYVKDDDTFRMNRVLDLPTDNYDHVRAYNDLVWSIYLMPIDFEEKYQKFLKDNAKLIKELKNKFCIDFQANALAKFFFALSEGSKNFFQWAVNAYYRQNIRLDDIMSIFTWNECYGQLVKQLSRGTITAYNTKERIDELKVEMQSLRKQKRIADTMNAFNTVQKKMLKGATLSDKDNEALNKFAKLSDAKQLNFIKKVSSVDNLGELLRQLRFATSVHFDWNKDAFMDYIKNVEGIDCKVVFEKDNVVLLQVADYETIKRLAKTTNWCISKNKSYWNSYVEGRHAATQYIIFDFNKNEDDNLSIVGFTVIRNKGITNAHDFVNNDLTKNGNVVPRTIKSYISKYIASNNIYTILGIDGIDVSMFVKYDKQPYEWNKEAMLKRLYECVNKENVHVLCDNADGKMALMVTDSHIGYFFGEAYLDNISDCEWDEKHIIFFDFKKNKYDSSKIVFSIVESGTTDSASYLRNEHMHDTLESFDSKLIEFGLPYDIIKRPNNDIVKLGDAIMSYNVPMIKECLERASDKRSVLMRTIGNRVGRESLMNYVSATLGNFMSLDYLDFIYESKCTLTELLGESATDSQLRSLFNTMWHNRGTEGSAPTEEEINAFYEEKMPNKTRALFVGSYIAFFMIADKENVCNAIWRRTVSTIYSSARPYAANKSIADDLMLGIGKKLDFNRKCDDTITNWIRYVIEAGSDAIKEVAQKYIENASDSIKSYYEDEKKYFEAHKQGDSRRPSYFSISDLEAANVGVARR